MNAVDEVPVLVLHVLEADITEDTSIVEENIDTAEILDGSLNDGLAVLDAVVVGNRLTASGADLLDNEVCGLEDVSGCWGTPILSFIEIYIPLMTCRHPCENHRGR